MQLQQTGSVSQAEREETPSSGCDGVTLCGFSVVRPAEGSRGGGCLSNKGRLTAGPVSTQSVNQESGQPEQPG